MPYLDVRISVTPSADLSSTIAAALADLTVEVLGKKRELTSVAVGFVPPAQWLVGGSSVADQNLATFHLDVKITEGTNTREEKASYVSRAFAAVEATVGKLHPASYVVIHEVAADAWGYGGITQESRHLGGMEPVETRSDYRRKLIPASAADVYAAISDPVRLARWWGPQGFTSTIHEFDFHPGGRWLLTMHGPDGKDYPNESRFVRIVPNRSLEIEHLSGHHFVLRIDLVDRGASSVVSWRQTFDTVEHYERIAGVVATANEQNLERLAEEVRRSGDAT